MKTKIETHYSLLVAHEVLKALRRLASERERQFGEPRYTVCSWSNGREQGLCIQGFPNRTVAWAQQRSSDQIVVYSCAYQDVDVTTNLPTTPKGWDGRKEFDPEALDEAAQYILSEIVKA